MTRVLLISPSTTDADLRAHALAIESLHGVRLVRRAAPPEDRLAYVFRVAADLFRSRDLADVVVTVGGASLAAASIGWRGPIVHVPVGRLTKVEASLGRSLAKRGRLRLVTSSAAIARQAMQRVADVGHVRVIRPAAPMATVDRAAARARLGIADDVPLVYLPGVARPGSNHRLSMWAANILFFRDPATRVLMVGGGPRDDFVRRFATSAELWPAIVADATLNESDCALAADVAICTADGAPDLSPLEALARAGTPIVGMQATWQRERLIDVPATLYEEPKARLVARAALEALEGGSGMQTPIAASHADVAWRSVLESVPAHR